MLGCLFTSILGSVLGSVLALLGTGVGRLRLRLAGGLVVASTVSPSTVSASTGSMIALGLGAALGAVLVTVLAAVLGAVLGGFAAAGCAFKRAPLNLYGWHGLYINDVKLIQPVDTETRRYYLLPRMGLLAPARVAEDACLKTFK